ncbi:LLM class flavin-dependent oxidoreductase [Mycolicibacterium sp. BiH015]|uniref:LLM class flavin-dependent oxidoreductase n=1 Tax=Mycolicibacterium sp. BiH015 TaxID=3018808 RepID=UPI0022E07FCB|nr:LLM class flavin-dependent oxidoreductase [Mycolicibacterium sp. BiH015]MDA2891583.1 LLM class flavin-dependent oxidoreductase [Mycolicibacterium sp. BiH015]
MTDNAHGQIHVGVRLPAGADFDTAVRWTRTAEHGLLDFVLCENFTVLAALAATTERIGLVAVVDTTDDIPFEVARRLVTLDHLSRGRAGWACDGSGEFIAVVTKFWESWAPGAVLADRVTGHYVDPGRIHAVEHRGQRFTVRGVGTLPARPQGFPVLVQGFSTPTPANPRVLLPADDLDEFVDSVIPQLQKRGRFRTEYAGHTLREHLGL